MWPNSCTIAACLGAISDGFWIVFSDNDMKTLYDEAQNGSKYKSYPLDPKVGRRIDLAADITRRYANEVYDLGVSSMSVSMLSEEYYEAFKWFTVASGFKGNKAYNDDKEADGSIDNWHYGNPTYGHAVRMVWTSIVDNYAWLLKYNVYKNEKLKDMKQDGHLFRTWFIFFPTYEMPETTLPPHVTRDQVKDPDDKAIIIERENVMSQDGRTPIYKDYTGKNFATRMLLDIYKARA